MKFLNAAIVLCACTLSVAMPVNVQQQAVADVFARDIDSAPDADINVADTDDSGSLYKRVGGAAASHAASLANKAPVIAEAFAQKAAGEVMGAVLKTGRQPSFMKTQTSSPTAELRKGRPMSPATVPSSPRRAPRPAVLQPMKSVSQSAGLTRSGGVSQ